MKRKQIAIIVGRDASYRKRLGAYLYNRYFVLEASDLAEVQAKIKGTSSTDVALSVIDMKTHHWQAQVEVLIALRFRLEKPLLILSVDPELNGEVVKDFVVAPQTFFLRRLRGGDRKVVARDEAVDALRLG